MPGAGGCPANLPEPQRLSRNCDRRLSESRHPPARLMVGDGPGCIAWICRDAAPTTTTAAPPMIRLCKAGIHGKAGCCIQIALREWAMRSPARSPHNDATGFIAATGTDLTAAEKRNHPSADQALGRDSRMKLPHRRSATGMSWPMPQERGGAICCAKARGWSFLHDLRHLIWTQKCRGIDKHRRGEGCYRNRCTGFCNRDCKAAGSGLSAGEGMLK